MCAWERMWAKIKANDPIDWCQMLNDVTVIKIIREQRKND